MRRLVNWVGLVCGRSSVCVAGVLLVGLVLSPLLVGVEPIGGDADRLYRPIKHQLRESLLRGTVPFWSDAFGLGVPLVAESHVAAFYPLNLVFYRVFDVSTAYRLLMWVHFVAMAAAFCVFARVQGLTAAQASFAAVVFSLCGFQAVHAVHEPFYTLMPYLPLCMVFADRFVATGRAGWLAGLALAWGLQLTLGHFQIQLWTAGMSVLVGLARAYRDRVSWVRCLWILAGLGWGLGVGLVQLRLTMELTQIAGFSRPSEFLINYLFPPAHGAQWVFPSLYLGRPPVFDDGYWGRLGTNAEEACAYIGIVPLVLACVGMASMRGRSAGVLWVGIAVGTIAVATMPGWWVDGYRMVLSVPGFGWFRAPARYTLLTSLALVLLAGRGLDRGISAVRFRTGLLMACAIGLGGLIWTIWWGADAAYRLSLGPETFLGRWVFAGVSWAVGLGVIVLWRVGKVGAWAPVGAAVLELSILFFVGPIRWGRQPRLPEESPVLRRLLAEHDVGLVAGRLKNVVSRVGLTTAFPGLGITPPPPNYLLESAMEPMTKENRVYERWHRRFGVTHGVWAMDDEVEGEEIWRSDRDSGLDLIFAGDRVVRERAGWKIVRHPAPFPAAIGATRWYGVSGWGELFGTLSAADRRDEAWFLSEDRAMAAEWPGWEWPEGIHGGLERILTPAERPLVESWDGSEAIVTHAGTCVLIIRRAYYPGWTCRIDGGAPRAVLKANGGLIAAPLVGAGRHSVRFEYHASGFVPALVVSLVSTGLCLSVIITGVWRSWRGGRTTGSGGTMRFSG